MKKLVLMMMLATVAGSSMAQNSAVKKARTIFDESTTQEEYKDENGIKHMRTVINWDKVQEAQDVLTPAFTNEKTKDFAMAWNLQSDINIRYMGTELNKAASQQPLDTMRFFTYVTKSLDALHELIKADTKGTYKLNAQNNMQKFRSYYLYCGQFFSNNGDPANSHEAFVKWLEFPKKYSALDQNFIDLSAGDTDPNMVAYYAALTAYQSKQYDKMDAHKDMALAYAQDSETAHQLYLFATIERGDTAAWEVMAEQFALEGSAGDGIVQNILAHYFEKKNYDKVNQFSDDLIAQRPSDKLGPYAKGLVAMNQEKLEEAITWFDKALEIDPDYFDALFQAGTCYLNLAYAKNDELVNKKMTKAENDKAVAEIRAVAAKAEPYYLRIRETRPDETNRWAPRLRQIYYILDDKAKLEEVAPYCDL